MASRTTTLIITLGFAFFSSFTLAAFITVEDVREGNPRLVSYIAFTDNQSVSYQTLSSVSASSAYRPSPNTVMASAFASSSCSPDPDRVELTGRESCYGDAVATASASYNYAVKISPIGLAIDGIPLDVPQFISVYVDYLIFAKAVYTPDSLTTSGSLARIQIDSIQHEVTADSVNVTNMSSSGTEVLTFDWSAGIEFNIGLTAYATANASSQGLVDIIRNEYLNIVGFGSTEAFADPTIYLDPMYSNLFNIQIEELNEIENSLSYNVNPSNNSVPIPNTFFLILPWLLMLYRSNRKFNN